ncbi:hypothetical protein ASPTUDRAFT_189768 [Aspergillus tubingensis CBS 134.48]|uniref:Uncharacterized protein n=1 Tax=Aspergillus tubingensis (strain CBS 134.48) TaxID=767770 RepID=A0A1L9N940_ASPTC|nr:hypothetical protein ASPTUDRAFT_189768 [Aspergillus tubingensis CBS 134.48]
MAVAESVPHVSAMKKMRISDNMLKHMFRSSVFKLKNHVLETDMQRKIDDLTTQLAAFTDELSNLNPFLITEATVKKAMVLHPNNKAGKKVVQDALRAAKQD